MGTILFYSTFFSTTASSLVKPWIGIMAYYLLAILGPQYIWWWHFDGLRASLWVAVFTLGGIALQIGQNNYDFSFLKTKQNLWLALLWLCISLSYYFGPYVAKFDSYVLSPDQLFSITNSIFLFYFCASLIINDLKKVSYLGIIMIISAGYLIYWANSQYLNSNWEQFNMGRLMGPESVNGSSIYRDENTFAMLFVTGLPFIYYLGHEIKQNYLKYLLWCLIPLGCHAVFLTGSRGGLVGLCVLVLLGFYRTKHKFMAIPLIILFVLFYQWQAGSVMKERADTISEYESETSAEMRLTAWKGGLRIMESHPLIGVGLGSYITALPDFIESSPRVAHNTFMQFAAESGVGAGICYLVIVYLFFRNSKRIRVWCSENSKNIISSRIGHYNDACTLSFAGLTVCSLFLSLNTYEIYYFLLLISNALFVMISKPFVEA